MQEAHKSSPRQGLHTSISITHSDRALLHTAPAEGQHKNNPIAVDIEAREDHIGLLDNSWRCPKYVGRAEGVHIVNSFFVSNYWKQLNYFQFSCRSQIVCCKSCGFTTTPGIERLGVPYVLFGCYLLSMSEGTIPLRDCSLPRPSWEQSMSIHARYHSLCCLGLVAYPNLFIRIQIQNC